jgi:FkbM family methyltransferase
MHTGRKPSINPAADRVVFPVNLDPSPMPAKPRIAIFDPINPRERSFMRPLAAHLEDAWQVDFHHPGAVDEVARAARDCDVLWFEWCAPLAAHATSHMDLLGKKVIVRLHLFEAPYTNYPNEVFWGNVDHLVLVCHDMVEVVRARRADITRQTDVRVIYNAIECARFANASPKIMTDIAWVGRAELKKNPAMFLQILAKLKALDPAYRLHVAGPITEPVFTRYLNHMATKLGLSGHLLFYGHVDDMPAWFRDKGVLLSTTLYESFGLNIGEAMAAGAFPVIHDFPGADELWPRECLFSTVDEAVELICGARPGQYVDYVRERYDAPLQFAAVDALLAEPNRKKADQIVFTHQGQEVFLHLPDRKDHIQKSIALSGDFYEPEMLADMRERVRASALPENATAIDVGANIGNHTVYMSQVLGLHTLALEPSRRSYEVLCRNIALNGLEASVEAHLCGAGPAPGRAHVRTRDAGNWGMNQLCEDAHGEVEVRRLDDLTRTGPVVLMKVDVEGMELDVLRGAAGILRHDRPLLYVEAAEEAGRQRIEDFLAGFGYHIGQRFNATPTYLFLHPEGHLSAMARGLETPRAQNLRRRLRRRTG